MFSSIRVTLLVFLLLLNSGLFAQWNAMGAGFDSGFVFSIEAYSETELYYGGNFATSSGEISNIAMWDGMAWQPLGGGTNGTVFEVEKHPDGGIVVIGGFTYADGLLVSNIARWDGSSWSAIGGGTYSVPEQLVVLPDGTIYILDTSMVTYKKVLRKWDGSSWTDIYNFIDSSIVTDLATDATGQLIISGSFTTIGGVSANYIARYDGTTFHPMGTLGNIPYILKLDKLGQLYTRASSSIYKFDGSDWVLHANCTSLILDFDFDADGNMYVCGTFTTILGTPFKRIAVWNGTSYTALGDGLSAPCYDVEVVDNKVYAGGVFLNSETTISLKRAGYFLLPSLLPVTWGNVSALRSHLGVEIAWETYSEVNCDFFTVQRSADLIHWTDAAYQQGAGNSESLLSYEVLDRFSYDGQCYYRIVETDFNGDYSSSQIVAVEDLQTDNISMNFDGQHLQVLGNTPSSLTIIIFSSEGKLMHEAQLNMFETLDISNLATGIYIVNVWERNELRVNQKISVL